MNFEPTNALAVILAAAEVNNGFIVADLSLLTM